MEVLRGFFREISPQRGRHVAKISQPQNLLKGGGAM
jgi:hypothetical protein